MFQALAILQSKVEDYIDCMYVSIVNQGVALME